MLGERSDVKTPFGVSVRAWRGRLGISQEELAGRAGLHRTYVCDVERGARNLSLESIEKLAKALEISVASLFSYTEEAPDGEREGIAIPPNALVDILFAENQPEDVKQAMQTLGSVINRIHVVPDGEAALNFLFRRREYAQHQPLRRPQLVLLDLHLPKVDGLEVLRQVKRDERTAAIPVVVVAASPKKQDIHRTRRLGAAACISKPIGLRKLSEVTPQLSLQWALLKPASPIMVMA